MIYDRKFTLTALAASVGVAALLSGAPAVAQDQTPPPAPTDQQDQPPAKPDAEGATTVQGVTVTADQGGFKSSIDRKSYDLTKDLQVQAGASVADALRNLPGVNVDVQGNVSIRGDSNVVIMVDGKPSSLYAGQGGAQALQSLPADQYERAEVLTNPSAQFSPNGSAGIINLITSKSHHPESSASVRVMVGTLDNWRLGANGTYVGGPVTVTVNAGLVHDAYRVVGADAREGFDGAGSPIFTSSSAQSAENKQLGGFGRAGVDYDLDSNTRLSASVHGFGGPQDSQAVSSLIDKDGAGVPLLAQDRTDRGVDLYIVEGAELTYRRTFDGDQHDLTISLSSDRVGFSTKERYVDVNLAPAAPDSFDALFTASATTTTTLKVDYERPMPKDGQWKAGYELDDANARFDNSGFEGASSSTAPLDPTETDLFHFDRTIQALYTTYQQPFGKFTVLGGLRYETSRIDLDQETQRITGSSDEWRLYPSLHLQYRIDDAQQITASYSQRIERPDPQSFNPFRVINGPLDVSQGNPTLQPQQTQVYELGYQYRQGQTLYSATVYYKDNRGGVTPVEQDIGGGVILTTQENLLSSRSGGLEFVASGKLLETITYNVSGDAAWDQVDATPLGFPTRETGYALSGHGTISWQATPSDLFQANGFLEGKQLTAQGFVEPRGMLFLGYRHKFNPHLSLFATGFDMLDSMTFHQVLDTPLLHDDNDLHFLGRAVLIGLTYSFGGATKRDPQIDFGSGGAPH